MASSRVRGRGPPYRVWNECPRSDFSVRPKHHKGFLEGFVIDEVDKGSKSRIEKLGMQVAMTQTIMDSDEAKMRLAKDTISLAESIGK